eukprot:209375-Prymnesium_polylepis.1
MGCESSFLSYMYPWRHPSHPDPKGWTLQLVAKVVKAFTAPAHHPLTGAVMDEGKRQVWGGFWDFLSLQ